MCQKCGCNTCEAENTALVLNESVAPKAILSEGLKHHIDNNKPLTEHLYRAGSRAYFDLFAEARSLYSRGILEFTHEDDLALLKETHLGHYGMFEGKKVPLDFPIELNEQMDIYDEIANMEFGLDYDQLGPGEKEFVRDEIDNMSMRESLNENKINAFVDKFEDKIEKIPVIGPMISKGIDNLQGKVNTLVKTAVEEAGETREAMKIVARYMKGETIGKEKNEFLKTQLKDLFKISGAALAAIGFPPAAVMGFIIAKLGLGDELFKLDDADKTTTRGKDERKSIAGKIKTFDGVKYVPYKDILPYLEKGDISLGEIKRIDEAIANVLDEKKKAKKKGPKLNKPMRSSSGGKAYKVYVKDPKTGNIKTVRFGSGGLRAKINDRKARQAFAKRHKCSTRNDKTKASYWSCRLPRYAKLLGLKSSFSGFW